jgi:hypothetical protein
MMFQYTNRLRLSATDAYYPLERRRLDLPDTLPRYLRPAKWQLDDAKKRIKSTIEWRWSYQPELIAPEEVRLESETGKLYAFFDLLLHCPIPIDPAQHPQRIRQRRPRDIIRAAWARKYAHESAANPSSCLVPVRRSSDPA